MATFIFWVIYIIILVGVIIGLDFLADFIYDKKPSRKSFQNIIVYIFTAGTVFMALSVEIKRVVIGE